MRCPSCEAALSVPSRFCPECGTPINGIGDPATITLAKTRAGPQSSSDTSEEGRFAAGAILADRYRIVGLVGRGGMGEVYRATDLKLNQPVALKFLPESASRNARWLERFHGEVRIARQVSHPHVCRVYDIAEVGGAACISMEYVDGEDLGVLLRRIGRLPGDKALEVARKLCEGLAAAHAKGVLHRDLKPSNVMIDGRGEVLIMDFGLAAIVDQVAGAEVRVGTPAYMSPEQLAGREVTERSDIYSLGLVLYEIFTGRRAFAGSDRSVTPSAVSAVKGIDPVMESIIMRCLERDPAKRPQSALALARMLSGGDSSTEAPQDASSLETLPDSRQSERSRSSAAKRSPAWQMIGAVGVLVAVIAGAVYWYATRAASSPASPAQVIPLTSYPGEQDRASLSPDGKQVAFLWKKEDQAFNDVYVQMVGAEQPLRLTNDPFEKLNPVWSPDGRSIAFLRASNGASEISAIPALGGPELKLGRTEVYASGLDWSPDGKWLAFVDSPTSNRSYGIFLLSTETGQRSRLTSPASPTSDDDPAFSRDGKFVAFRRVFNPTEADLYIVPAAGGEPRRLTTDKQRIAGLAWSADGREIIFSSVRSGPPSLWRLPVGAPDKLQRVAVGENGVHPTVSRDGQRLAFTDQFTDSNIWRVEISESGQEFRHNPPVKFLASTRADHSPKYSPDGRRIAFNSDRSGREEIWRCDSNGTNLVQLTHFGGKGAGTPRWSPDGRQIAFDSRIYGAGDIFIMGTEGGAPRRLTTEPSHDVMPSWSKDGRQVYFCSDRSGRYEVWKAPAEGGLATQVTWKGGFEAFESADGDSLYYTKGRFPGLWRMELKDGAPAGPEAMVPAIRNTGQFRYWVVTKAGVFFVPEEHTSVYAIQFFDFRSGNVIPVFTLEKEPVLGPPGLDVSPDGRWILYSQVDQKVSNITLVEGFR